MTNQRLFQLNQDLQAEIIYNNDSNDLERKSNETEAAGN